MKNIVILQKDEDGNIYCQEVSEKGIEYMEKNPEESLEYWKEGGTILLEELNEILDKEI